MQLCRCAFCTAQDEFDAVPADLTDLSPTNVSESLNRGLAQNQRLERALSLRDIITRNGLSAAPCFLYAPEGLGLTQQDDGPRP